MKIREILFFLLIACVPVALTFLLTPIAERYGDAIDKTTRIYAYTFVSEPALGANPKGGTVTVDGQKHDYITHVEIRVYPISDQSDAIVPVTVRIRNSNGQPVKLAWEDQPTGPGGFVGKDWVEGDPPTQHHGSSRHEQTFRFKPHHELPGHAFSQNFYFYGQLVLTGDVYSADASVRLVQLDPSSPHTWSDGQTVPTVVLFVIAIVLGIVTFFIAYLMLRLRSTASRADVEAEVEDEVEAEVHRALWLVWTYFALEGEPPSDSELNRCYKHVKDIADHDPLDRTAVILCARVEKALGRRTDAIKRLGNAIDSVDALDAEARELHAIDLSDFLFNSACYRALESKEAVEPAYRNQQTLAALDDLTRSIGINPDNRQYLGDPELDAIRNQPRFEALLETADR